jgi:hypothetical protein
MPAFAQAVRESARNSIPLSNGLGVVDVNVLYHSLLGLAEQPAKNPENATDGARLVTASERIYRFPQPGRNI